MPNPIDTPQSKIIDGLAHAVWFRPNTTDDWCLKKVFVDREYAVDLAIEPDVIVDAGANVGYASVFFADRYPNAKVLAIEPASSNFALLKRNAEPYENIVPIHAALWHCQEDVAISDPGKGAWAFRTSARDSVDRPHLRMELSDLKEHPTREIDRIIDHLQLSPTDEQHQAAVKSVIV